MGRAGGPPSAARRDRATSPSRRSTTRWSCDRRCSAGHCAASRSGLVDPETGARTAAGEVGELLLPRLLALRGLLQGSRADRDRRRRRGLVPHRRSGRGGRGGQARIRGPAQGHVEGGRRERLGARGRGLPRRHPPCQIVQVVAAPDEKYAEVPAAFVQLKPRRRGRARTRSIGLRRGDRELQGPPVRARLRRGVADVGDEDPEVRPPRAPREELSARPRELLSQLGSNSRRSAFGPRKL